MRGIEIVKAPFVAIARVWRRQRRAQEWTQKRREFVYLDETSVTSLVAARHGSVPESFKDTLSLTKSAERGASFTVPSTPESPGVGLSARSTSSRSSSQEVVHRAVVQGTFRSLRIGDTDLRLSVEDQLARPRPVPAATANALAGHLSRLEGQHRAVRTSDLVRGDVVELRVELSPEWSYQVTAAVSSMIDLVDGRAGMLGIEEGSVAEVQQILQLLSRLLVDLVPLRAQVTSHRLVEVDGVPWLVDVSMIEEDSALDRDAREVHLAGVTELPLYWKDVRRVLFAGSEYSVYARLSRPGIQASWSSVKLADVFDRFLPEIGDQIRALPDLLDNAERVDHPAEAPSVSEVLRDKGLVPFGRDLARLALREIAEKSLLDAATDAALSVASVEELQDVGIVRSAFEKVVTAVEASSSLKDSSEPIPIDRELVRALRETHQEVARLTLLNQVSATAGEQMKGKSSHANLLEAEVVAIYW